MAAARDPAQEITDYFIARLAEGHRPWVRPWTAAGSPYPLRADGKPFSGMNRFWLDIMGSAAGYLSPYWLTYKQAQTLGGQVRKGAHGQFALFYKQGVTKEKPDETLAPDDPNQPHGSRSYRLLRSYTVFNADQIQGLDDQFHPAVIERPVPTSELQPEIDAYVAAIPVKITHGGDRACFRPAFDDIYMPPVAAFNSYESYAATKLHEIGHWTGGKPRLDRTFGKSFGDNVYAAEELVAEMYSHLISRQLGLPEYIHDNSVAYIASWLKVLRGDKTALLSAASKAQAAFEYVQAFQQVETPVAIAA